MSRAASTAARTEEIILKQLSPNAKSVVTLEVYDDTNEEYVVLDDFDSQRGVTWTVSGKKQKYAAFSFLPLAGTIDFSVINKDGEYSEGSGTAKEGLIDNEKKVRLKAGHLLSTTGASDTSTLNLNDTSGLTVKSYFWHTEYTTGGVVSVSAVAGSSSAVHFSDLSTLDAYTVQTYDSLGRGYHDITSFDITCNHTQGTVYWRAFNATGNLGYSETANWTNAGATVNGVKTVTVGKNTRYLQVAVVYTELTFYDDSLDVSDITITYAPYVEWILTSVYYLDTPKFNDPPAPEMPMIKCKGRDALKRGISSDINLPDLSAGKAVDDLIKDICDQVNIPYSATSIADLSSFSNRVLEEGLRTTTKAVDVFEYCMQIINPSRYQMYLEYDADEDENVLFVQLRPNIVEANGAFSFRNYISVGDSSKNADQILKRITVLTENVEVNPELLLGTGSYTTSGTKTITWTGNAEHKRVVVTNADLMTFKDVEVTPTSFQFFIETITGTVTVKVYGSKWAGLPDSAGFNGSGLDDLSVAGKFTGSTVITYKVKIDGIGTPDTFEWFKDGVQQATGVAITDYNTLDNGVAVRFSATVGHTNNDEWEFRTKLEQPRYEGEAIELTNMINSDGSTYKIENPLIISNDEGQDIAESYITDFGTPVKEAKDLKWPYLRLLPEMNEAYLLWRRFVFNDDLFYITKIKYFWSENKEDTSFGLDDTGLNFTDLGDFIYDDIMDYEAGFLYDMGISDARSTDAEIDTASDAVVVHNVAVS